MGTALRPMMPGVDCPLTAVYLDVVDTFMWGVRETVL